MAERNADNPEFVVDEMKRKARRRLVGAIVLALAAAIIVPMLLEKEPRPLGDDVSVQIPPVDEGKFVNRLTGKAGDAKALPKADGKASAGAAAGKSEPKAEIPLEAAAPAASAPPGPPAAAGNESLVPRKSVAEAEQRVIAPSAKPAPKAEAKPAAAPAASASAPATMPSAAPAATPVTAPSAASATASAPAPAAAPAKADGFVVQLAAFADDKGANALANKLKKGGYAAFVQPVETSRGTLWRVRVGGYGSRPEAEAARATLKGEGYSGMVAPAQ